MDQNLVSGLVELTGIEEEVISKTIANMTLQNLTRMVSYYNNEDKDSVIEILTGTS